MADDDYNHLHALIYNEIARGLAHCYESADASGMSWTTEGHFSVSANLIIGALKQAGAVLPFISEKIERIDIYDMLADCLSNEDGESEAADRLEAQQAEIERLRDRSCSTCVHGRKRPAEAYEPDCYSCAGVLKGNSFAMPFYCSAYEEARRG